MRVQQELAKETKVIAALKQHYERYHAGDLAALKKLYEYHAENCVRAAELTVDRRLRGRSCRRRLPNRYIELILIGPIGPIDASERAREQPTVSETRRPLRSTRAPA